MKKIILTLSLSIIPLIGFCENLQQLEKEFKNCPYETRLVGNMIFEAHEREALKRYPNDPMMRAFYISWKMSEFCQNGINS